MAFYYAYDYIPNLCKGTSRLCFVRLVNRPRWKPLLRPKDRFIVVQLTQYSVLRCVCLVVEKVQHGACWWAYQGQMVQLWTHAASFHASSQHWYASPVTARRAPHGFGLYLKPRPLKKHPHKCRRVLKKKKKFNNFSGPREISCAWIYGVCYQCVCQLRWTCHSTLTHVSKFTQEAVVVGKTCKMSRSPVGVLLRERLASVGLTGFAICCINLWE